MIAIDRRLLAAAAVSVAAHLGLARAVEELPQRPGSTWRPRVEVRVVEAPPPPPEEPEPELEPEPPPAATADVVHERPRVRPTRAAATSAEPVDAPTASAVPGAADPSGLPVFGVTLSSTSSRGGPPVPVGNAAAPGTGRRAGGQAGPGAEPVAAAAEVTAMPVPLGRCSGAYTEAARAAGAEGTVVLDLVVDPRGRSRDIVVVEGLGHGLTQAALTALRNCRFRPGEKDGHPVAVRVRGFKIHFVLQR